MLTDLIDYVSQNTTIKISLVQHNNSKLGEPTLVVYPLLQNDNMQEQSAEEEKDSDRFDVLNVPE